MAFNGSGTFNRLYSFATISASADPVIRSTHMDAELDGVATALSNCITKDGQTTPTTNIPFGGYRLTGVGDATNAQDAITKNNLATGVALGQSTISGNFTHTALDIASTDGHGYGLYGVGTVVVQVDSGAADTDILYSGYRGTTRNVRINANGDFQSATNSYGSTSDRSLKRDIGDMDDVLADLLAVPMRKYRRIDEYAAMGDDAPYREGVIADEAEDAFADLVATDGDGLKSVNYMGLALKGVRAIQELAAVVTALEARIETLEGE